MEEKNIGSSHEHASHEHHEHEDHTHEHQPVENRSLKSFFGKCCSGCCKIKNIKPRTAIIIGVVIVILAACFAFRGVFVAAMVDGSPISRLAVIEELERSSGKAALENLIVEKLISNEAAKKGIKITDDQVNTEIATIESQIKGQGGTLEEALTSQGMTLEILKRQISIQKKLEALLVDKVQITDADVQKFITDNKITIPKGEEVSYNTQIVQQIKQQKLTAESKTLIETLKSENTIRYFVSY